MPTQKSIPRLVLIGLMLLAFLLIITLKLVDLQLVHGIEYEQTSERKIVRSYTVKASRGEIVDRYGRPLVTNKMVFTVRLDYVYWDKENQNDVILRLTRLLQQHKVAYDDSLPVSTFWPYSYTFGDGESAAKKQLDSFLKDQKKAPEDPSAEELMDYLKTKYKIDPSLSERDQRTIAGVRYELERRDFSGYNTLTFAKDIDMDLVSQLSEIHLEFPGVVIDQDTVREYRTDFAAHILGRTNVIFKEDWPEYKAKGYPMDAVVGTEGMEKALEDHLRGIDGVRTVETNISGKITNEVSSKDPEPGGNCVLTIDLGLQQVAEQSLAQTIQSLRRGTLNGEYSPDVEGGAVVALDVKTAEVLALANYPTYNLRTFSQDYQSLLENDLKPLYNRAIQMATAPGSTFKMVTALAGLQENVITPQTVIRDQGVYTFYAPSYTPACWIWNQYKATHGNQNVSQAIENSCNYFFFEVGRQLTIERLNKYGKLLGLGEKTGIELPGESSGNLAGPESRKANDGPMWMPGETIQAAIGQSDQQITPIQLANYVATIVNGGTRHRTHLLKGVKKYDYTEDELVVEPEVMSEINIEYNNLRAIMEGMRSVAEDGTASNVFQNYSIPVGGKTGSAQTRSGRSAHGVFVAFAPYDDPEIAICVIGEYAGSGNRMAYVARDMFDYYFKKMGQIDQITQQDTLLS